MKKLYLDNAATSFPKAPLVAEAITDYIKNIGSNVGRGIYENSLSAGQTVYETRELLCKLFNYDNPMNLVFTSNITQSLNMIIKGLFKSGDHIIISSMEHNAVMRPLNTMQSIGVEVSKIPCNMDGTLDTSIIENYIKENTKAIIMTHASNVCGTILPLKIVGEICKKHNLYFIADTAQTAGIIDIDFKEFNLSALAFTGHKGLLGPQGIGGFILDDSIKNKISPLIEGGTGSESESEIQPTLMPDKFESGTPNIPGIYGLNASLKYLLNNNINEFYNFEMELTSKFINDVQNIPNIKLCGLNSISGRTAVISLDFINFDNSEIAFNLDRNFGIMTRVGLHCAPSAHMTLKTFPRGTVRFSFSHFNTENDVKYTVDSIFKTLKSLA